MILTPTIARLVNLPYARCVHPACQTSTVKCLHVLISSLTSQLAGQEGVIPALLQIIASDNVDMYVNLLHVIDLVFVRNHLLHHYDAAFFRGHTVPLARPSPFGSKTVSHPLTVLNLRGRGLITSQSLHP